MIWHQKDHNFHAVAKKLWKTLAQDVCKEKTKCSERFPDKLMVASKHRSRRKIFRKCPECLWLESGVLAGKDHSITAPFLRVFSGHSKGQDILFSQPLVFPEVALTLLFDNKNVNRLWRVEFLLLILSNTWTLSEQLRFCLHIQQDTVKEAICPQINYFILHCFCGAKWMRCPLPPHVPSETFFLLCQTCHCNLF